MTDVQVAFARRQKGEKIGRLLSARELEVQFELPVETMDDLRQKEGQDQSEESILGRPLK